MPNYDGKCLLCGFTRRDGSKVGAHRHLVKSHARKSPDCKGDFHIFNNKGREVVLGVNLDPNSTAPAGQPLAPDQPRRKRKTQPSIEVHFCPRCGFNMELLRMAVGAVERMQ